MADLIRRYWCRRYHPWRGWELAPERKALVRSPVTYDPIRGVTTVHRVSVGHWSRKPCRFCKGHDDEMPRVSDR